MWGAMRGGGAGEAFGEKWNTEGPRLHGEGLRTWVSVVGGDGRLLEWRCWGAAGLERDARGHRTGRGRVSRVRPQDCVSSEGALRVCRGGRRAVAGTAFFRRRRERIPNVLSSLLSLRLQSRHPLPRAHLLCGGAAGRFCLQPLLWACVPSPQTAD